MPFEQFDKKIKEAADHHHPAYDEQAWAKMEKLLDKHLPQKDDNRRRVLFFILIFVGLGCVGLLVTKPWKKDKDTIAANQPVNKIQTPSSSSDQTVKTGTVQQAQLQTMGSDEKPTLVSTDAVKNPQVVTPTNPENPKSNLDPVVVNKSKAVISRPGLTNAIPSQDRVQENIPIRSNDVGGSKKDRSVVVPGKTDTNPSVVSKNKSGTEITGTEAPVNSIDVSVDPAIVKRDKNEVEKNKGVKKAEETTDAVDNKNTTAADKKDESKKDLAKIADVSKQAIKSEGPAISKEASKKSKSQGKKVSNFFLSFSAGPDISFVSNNKAGEVKAVVGAGIGYTLKDRWTVRTGFYSGRKVYTATADAYDPPAGFSALYPYLEKVDADCKIYEIPVSLSYEFGKKSSRNWFVSTGLSTFLMKEETYNYYYKYTPQGNTYTNKWTIKDQNSHFFSVATLSAGYKKDISKRVTLVAEPYMKIPVGGVGYGKVKLNSGGVLFTIGVKPF